VVDAPHDALLGLVSHLGFEHMLEQRGVTGPFAAGPGEQLVEALAGVGHSEEGEMGAEPLSQSVVGEARSGGSAALRLRLVGFRGTWGRDSVGRWERRKRDDGRRSAAGRTRSGRGLGAAHTERFGRRRAVSSATYSSSVRGAERAATMRSTARGRRHRRAPRGRGRRRDRQCRSAP